VSLAPAALVLAQLATPAPATTAAATQVPDPPGPPRLAWNEDRPRFRPLEYVVTGVVGLAAMAEYTWAPPQREPHWTGGILFDDAVRNALRVSSPSARVDLWTAAGAVGVSEVVLTVGIDSILVPLVRGSPDVMWQLAWIDLESYALGSVVTFTLYDTVGRARPSYGDCQRDPSLPDCVTSPYASFPSGHVAESFLSAGLSCVNHAYVPIYGSKLFDTLACARDLTLASADGVLRIMGDRHWASDVLAGAGIGFVAGYALPVALHYASGKRDRAAGLVVMPMVPAGDERIGAVVTGSF
jgi:membrane-associated phospholipid phosphatase